MANYNKIILVGNLTRDPQLTYLPSQTAVVDFGLAVNRTWNDQNSQKREEVCFIDVRAFGKQAETINHYLSKGRQILVEGRLQFQQWQAQDGSKRSKHIVVVESFQFLGGGQGQQGQGQQGSAPEAGAVARPPMRTRAAAPAQNEAPASEYPPDNIPAPEEDAPQQHSGSEDDIPF
jgi:single-strand DNA-binding protein